MKRLDLIDGFVERVMRRSVENMKNGMSLFAKVVVLVMMTMFATNLFAYDDTTTDSDGKPYHHSDGNWYALFCAGQHNSDMAGGIAPTASYDRDPYVYAPVTGNLSFVYKTTDLYVALTAYTHTSGDSWTNLGQTSAYRSKDGEHTYSATVSTNIDRISIKRTDRSGAFYTKNLKLRLAQHILLDNSTTYGTDDLQINEINDASHVYIGQAKKITIPFRSFLTNGNITVSMTSGDSKIFRVDNSTTKCTTTTSYTLVNLGANACGIKGGTGSFTYTTSGTGGPGNASTYDIVVWYYPTSESTQTAVFSISDGTSTATATIKAKGVKKSMSFGETYVGEGSSKTESFTMTNLTGNITVTAPSHFQVKTSGGSWTNTITLTGGSSFDVRFAPLDDNPTSKSGDVVMTDAANNQYKIAVSGTAKKHDQTIVWGEKNALLLGEELLNAATLTVGEGSLTYHSSDVNVIKVFDANGVDQGTGWGVVLQGYTGGNATITAKASSTTAYNEATSTQTFYVTRRKMQTIVWTDDPTQNAVIPVGSTTKTVSIDAVAYEYGTTTPSGKGVTFSSSNTSIATIDNNAKQITFHDKGNVIITATAEGDEDEPVGSESKYLPATSKLYIYVRKKGETCSQYVVEPREIHNNDSVYFQGPGIAVRLTATLKWNYWAHFVVRVKDQNGNELWKKYVERKVTGGTASESVDVDLSSKNVTSFIIEGVAEDNEHVWFEDFKVTQKTEFTPENKTVFNYAPTIIHHSQPDQTLSITYANLSEDIVATITDNDNGRSKQCFTVENFIAADCYQHNTATFHVGYTPRSTGDHSATVTFSSKASGATVSKSVTLNGSCTKETQTIAWVDPLTTFSNLHALSTYGGNIYLNSSISTESTLLPKFTVYDQNPDGVASIVEDEDGYSYLKINKGGTFSIKAQLPGDDDHEPSNVITNISIPVSLVKPNFTITGNQTPDLFDPFWVTASSSGTATAGYSLVSPGVVSFAIDPDYNTHASVSDLDQANKKCKVTVNSRVTETGQPVHVVATLAATEIYDTKTATLEVSAKKVTPVIVWSEPSGTQKVGDVVQLNAYVQQSNSLKVEYESYNTNLATVDNTTGKMTCKAAGVVKITAKITTGNCDFKTTTQTISYLFLISPANFGNVEILSSKAVPFVISTGVSGGTFSISATDNGKFFFSKNQTDEWKTGWEDKSLTSISDGSTVYIKFQPNATGDITKTFKVTYNSKEYSGSLAGTGTAKTGAIQNAPITQGRHYGWTYDTPLPENFFRSSSDTYSVSLSGDDEFFVQKNGTNDFVRQITGIAKGTKYRIGYFPKNYKKSGSVTVTVTDSYFGISYSYTVSGTAVELSHDFGTGTAVGTASAGYEIEMSYFDLSNNMTATAPNHFLLSANGTSNFVKSLKFTTTRAKFYVHYAPESSSTTAHSGSISIKDNKSSSAYNYEYLVSGTPTESKISFNCHLEDPLPVEPFTMTNFKCSTNVKVTTASNSVFEVSDGVNGYSNEATIGAAGTFNVRLKSTSDLCSTDEEIIMRDMTTSREYHLKVEADVSKKPVEIVVPEALTYYTNDLGQHILVGTGNEVHCSMPELDDNITLSPVDDALSYIDIIDGKSVRVKAGIDHNVTVMVTASIPEFATTAAASETFAINIKYLDPSVLSAARWKYNTSDQKWYVLNTYDDGAQISSGSTDMDVEYNVYLPNVDCSGDFGAKLVSTTSIDAWNHYFVAIQEKTSGGSYSDMENTREAECTLDTWYEGTCTTTVRSSLTTLRPRVTNHNGNTRDKYARVKITVPLHYDVKSYGTRTIPFNDTEVGEVSYVDVPLTDMFVSFRTSGKGMKIEQKNDNPVGVFFFSTPTEG